MKTQDIDPMTRTTDQLYRIFWVLMILVFAVITWLVFVAIHIERSRISIHILDEKVLSICQATQAFQPPNGE